MTEALIQKQTMLESLSTEKNSLVFQLERLEQQMKSATGSGSNGSSINMSGVDNGEGKKKKRNLKRTLVALISNLANPNTVLRS